MYFKDENYSSFTSASNVTKYMYQFPIKLTGSNIDFFQPLVFNTFSENDFSKPCMEKQNLYGEANLTVSLKSLKG